MELAEIDGPIVYLRLKGACGSCPSSMTTMTMGIKRRLQEKIPVRSSAAGQGTLELPGTPPGAPPVMRGCHHVCLARTCRYFDAECVC